MKKYPKKPLEEFEEEFNKRKGYYDPEKKRVLTLKEGLYKAYKIGLKDGQR